MVKFNKFFYTTIALSIVTVILLFTTIFYYFETIRYQDLYNDLKSDFSQLKSDFSQLNELLISVSLLIDFGNGTSIWFNGTTLKGTTLFEYTFDVTNGKLEYKEFTGLGYYISSILGVSENVAENKYWLWYYFSENEWKLGEVGADSYVIKNKDILAWKYEQITF